MDPVCHTLVGASLSATGLGSKTRFGCATLLIAANLPDVDAVTYGVSATTAYAVRRGITHGLPALVVLPFVLAAAVALVARWRPNDTHAASFRWLLLLSAIGVASHPSLDWLNNYGMRWLMPFVNRWFYGDTLFIADWVVWVALAVGLFAARKLRHRSLRWFRRPAVLSLAFVLAYIGTSFGLTRLAVAETLAAVRSDPPNRIMASPVMLNPLRRDIVIEYDGEYRFGAVRFAPGPKFEMFARIVAMGDPALLARAREQREGRQFLSWARFPYAVLEQTETGAWLWLADARYVPDLDAPRMRSFGFVRLPLLAL